MLITVNPSKLLAKLELEDLDLILRKRRFCWFGHVERSGSAIRTVQHVMYIFLAGGGAGRPKLITWKKTDGERLP